MTIQNKNLAHALTRALNERSESAITALFAEDGVFLSARAGLRFIGPVEAAAAMMSWLNQSRPGSTLETLREFYVGDEGYSEWKFTGIDLKGEPVETHGIDYFRFADGKITEKSSFRKV